MQELSQRATALRYALEQAEFPPDASHNNCGWWFQDLVGSHPWKLVLSNWSETGNIEYLLSLLANFTQLAKMESIICPLKLVMEVTRAEVARLCNDLWFSLISHQATTEAPENHKHKLADMLEGTIRTNVDLSQVDIPATLKLLKCNDLQERICPMEIDSIRNDSLSFFSRWQGSSVTRVILHYIFFTTTSTFQTFSISLKRKDTSICYSKRPPTQFMIVKNYQTAVGFDRRKIVERWFARLQSKFDELYKREREKTCDFYIKRQQVNCLMKLWLKVQDWTDVVIFGERYCIIEECWGCLNVSRSSAPNNGVNEVQILDVSGSGEEEAEKTVLA
ncbi:hypothetical protein BT69DRAFT_1299715 [Atractiella rhizophila]|nr:hypothetical protein BT69DRAFT_1299715 [Atractiella rhizophila]